MNQDQSHKRDKIKPKKSTTKKIKEIGGRKGPDGTNYNNSTHPVAHVFGDKSKREWRSSYFSLIDSEFRSYSNHKYGNEIILFSPKSIELKSKVKDWPWTSTRRSRW